MPAIDSRPPQPWSKSPRHATGGRSVSSGPPAGRIKNSPDAEVVADRRSPWLSGQFLVGRRVVREAGGAGAALFARTGNTAHGFTRSIRGKERHRRHSLTLKQSMERAGYDRALTCVDKARSVPGPQQDGPFDTVTLSHTNQDRAASRRSPRAARVVHRKQVVTMRDVLGLRTVGRP